MFLNFAGHFVRQTMGPLLDILGFYRTFHFFQNGSRASENLPLRQTFELSANHVRQVWRISSTLKSYLKQLWYLEESLDMRWCTYRHLLIYSNFSSPVTFLIVMTWSCFRIAREQCPSQVDDCRHGGIW